MAAVNNYAPDSHSTCQCHCDQYNEQTAPSRGSVYCEGRPIEEGEYLTLPVLQCGRSCLLAKQ